MRTTISLDDGLLRRAKKAAVQRGVSLARLIEAALRETLVAKPPLLGPLDLPVSTAHGGLRPGIDPSKNETMWAAIEADD